MKRLVASLALVVVALGCSSLLPGKGVDIRIRNASSAAMTDMLIQWPHDQMSVASLPAGETTEYERRDGAFSYGYIRTMVNGTKREVIPIDYVGEQPLEPG